MFKLKKTLYILPLLLLVLFYTTNVECKKRHHRHKKVVPEAEETPAVTVNSDAGAAAQPEPTTAYAAPDAAATPNAAYTPKVAAADTAAQANAQSSPASSSTKENIQKNDSEQKDKSSYKWSNHTIPFLKRFKKEVDNGKIKHHNYEEMTWFLKYFAEEYPDITRLYSIGKYVISYSFFLRF